MSIISEIADSRRQQARALGRRDGIADRRVAGFSPPGIAAEPTATVTLGKIGDFLEIDFRRLFAWLRRGLAGSLTLAVVVAGLGGLYAVGTKPVYTVSSDVLIDPSNLQVVPDNLYAQPGQIDGQLRVAGSKLRVLTSGNVLMRVVDELDLVADKEFYDPHPAGGFSLSSLFGTHAAAAPADPRLAALGKLERDVSTRADDNSYVAELLVSAGTPDKAVRISNAIVQAFKDELAKADADGAARAAAALDERLNGLKQDVETAEQKVAAYKQAHDLVSANGQSVTAQTVSELNTQVVDAHSRVIAAQSAYDALRTAGRNAVPTDAAAAAALTALRSQADSLRQQVDSAAMVYGPRHPTLLRLKAQLAAANAQVDAEVARVTAGAKSSLAQAQASLAALKQRQQSLTGGLFADNEAQVGLNQLQRDADSKSAIYQSFLSRAQQITQSEQIDTTNVRVISTAVPPADPSWPPRPALLTGLGLVGGFVAGLLLAIVLGVWGDMRAARRLGAIRR